MHTHAAQAAGSPSTSVCRAQASHTQGCQKSHLLRTSVSAIPAAFKPVEENKHAPSPAEPAQARVCPRLLGPRILAVGPPLPATPAAPAPPASAKGGIRTPTRQTREGPGQSTHPPSPRARGPARRQGENPGRKLPSASPGATSAHARKGNCRRVRRELQDVAGARGPQSPPAAGDQCRPHQRKTREAQQRAGILKRSGEAPAALPGRLPALTEEHGNGQLQQPDTERHGPLGPTDPETSNLMWASEPPEAPGSGPSPPAHSPPEGGCFSLTPSRARLLNRETPAPNFRAPPGRQASPCLLSPAPSGMPPTPQAHQAHRALHPGRVTPCPALPKQASGHGITGGGRRQPQGQPAPSPGRASTQALLGRGSAQGTPIPTTSPGAVQAPAWRRRDTKHHPPPRHTRSLRRLRQNWVSDTPVPSPEPLCPLAPHRSSH
ncbi:basic salivary proline-rich protein 1-like [Physeter macrocephalus]|uniref:Basic salivary proline-rich protein 1-like n=1 Tax=Physeter macrocephalus TaxID=9755 RepID=A0A2Y9SZ70_PHYMC|nr:basic salivary proline-rich protein 1-like [Physeter catodon]|eukprot:XP_023981865.1 basic salivary proline-rich protein 1-like [Physeter catodon]